MSDLSADLVSRFRDKLHYDLLPLASDLRHEFDDVLSVPIRDPERFSEAVAGFMDDCARRDYGEAHDIDGRYALLLRQLETNGEDIDLLCLWLASGAERSELGQREGYPDHYWQIALRRWARRGFPKPKYAPEESLDRLVTSYREESDEPSMAFYKRHDEKVKEWSRGPSYRSARDERLLRAYEGYMDMSPTWPFAGFYSQVLDQRWWRGYAASLEESLDEEEREDLMAELTAEMVLALYQAGEADIVKWEYVWPLDRAFDLSGVPDFDEVKRDW